MGIESINSLASPTPIDTSGMNNQQAGMGKDDFLKLLIAQIKNQDPTDPMDSREMITQLSELTGVEKLSSIESRLQALEIANAGMANTQTAALVGKNVTADSSMIRLDAAGAGNAPFEIDQRAVSMKAVIRDNVGNIVRTIEIGETYPGSHLLDWDGNTDSGARAAPGRYTLEMSGKDEAGNPIGVSTEITGRVSGVSYSHGYPELIVGDARIMLGDVNSIQE